MPETVFYSNGCVDFITSNDRERHLRYDTKTKLNNPDVCKKIRDVVTERRKDNEVYGKGSSHKAGSRQLKRPGRFGLLAKVM